MWTFKAYFKKEFIEFSRQYKYIILAAGILIFALLDPIILKLLPKLLVGTFPKEVIAQFTTTQTTAIQSYIKNINQIGFMVIIFIFSGALSDEIYNQKLVFPYSKGASPKSIVLAKLLNYTLTVSVLVCLGFIINFFYSSILFPDTPIEFIKLLPTMVLVNLYLIFNITLVMMFSSIFEKGLVAGIITIVLSLATVALAGIKDIGNYIPYNLIKIANTFSFEGSTTTIIFVLVLSTIFMMITIFRMNKVEVI